MKAGSRPAGNPRCAGAAMNGEMADFPGGGSVKHKNIPRRLTGHVKALAVGRDGDPFRLPADQGEVLHLFRGQC